MSKRFTETEKWKDPWFRKLPPAYKCFWIYICDNCNNAGIWNIDFELAEMLIGAPLDLHAIGAHFSERIKFLDQKYIQITGFIQFQYGELHKDSKPHQQVLKLLEKYGVSKGYPKGIHTLKDKDKEKDKDKDKDYVLPNPETDPVKCLVLTYKTTKGFAFDDRDWDKVNYGRSASASKTLLNMCKDFNIAEACIKGLGEEYDKKGLTWTLETVTRNAGEWLKRNGRIDENSSKSGLRMAIARQRSKTENSGGLVKVSEGSVLDAFRDGKDSPSGDQADIGGERRGLDDENVA